MDRTINNIEVRRNKKKLNALIQTKVLDKNKKGVSVSKSVDSDTRTTMEFIKANKSLSMEEIIERMSEIESNAKDGVLSEDEMTILANLEIVQLLASANTSLNTLTQIDAEIKSEWENITAAIETLKAQENVDRKALKQAYDMRKNVDQSLRREKRSATGIYPHYQ